MLNTSGPNEEDKRGGNSLATCGASSQPRSRVLSQPVSNAQVGHCAMPFSCALPAVLVQREDLDIFVLVGASFRE